MANPLEIIIPAAESLSSAALSLSLSHYCSFTAHHFTALTHFHNSPGVIFSHSRHPMSARRASEMSRTLIVQTKLENSC